MITIVTGVPGSGKSSWFVDQLYQGAFNGRPIFINGIPQLTLPHFELENPQDWFNCPEGSVIVVDEAQRFFRPRHSSSAVPEYIAQLETHRHEGMDLILITQHANLLDANVKRLCGRHIHIRVTPIGRYLFEWPEVSDPSSKTDRSVAASKRYALPKRVFSLYKSATVHTKMRLKLPWMVYTIGAAILAAGYFSWRGYESVQAKTKPHSATLGAVVDGGQVVLPGQPVSANGKAADNYSPAAFVPRVVNLPESAPAYDGIREVKQMRRISACVSMGSRCDCFDQQGIVVQTSPEFCPAYVAKGRFDPYAEGPALEQPAGSLQPAATSAPTVPPVPAG